MALCWGVALGRRPVRRCGVGGAELQGDRGRDRSENGGKHFNVRGAVGGASKTGATPTTAEKALGEEGGRGSKVELRSNFGGSKYLSRFLYIDMQVVFFSL